MADTGSNFSWIVFSRYYLGFLHRLSISFEIVHSKWKNVWKICYSDFGPSFAQCNPHNSYRKLQDGSCTVLYTVHTKSCHGVVLQEAENACHILQIAHSAKYKRRIQTCISFCERLATLRTLKQRDWLPWELELTGKIGSGRWGNTLCFRSTCLFQSPDPRYRFLPSFEKQDFEWGTLQGGFPLATLPSLPGSN